MSVLELEGRPEEKEDQGKGRGRGRGDKGGGIRGGRRRKVTGALNNTGTPHMLCSFQFPKCSKFSHL